MMDDGPQSNGLSQMMDVGSQSNNGYWVSVNAMDDDGP